VDRCIVRFPVYKFSGLYRVAQKVSHYRISTKIVLKPVNQIRFIRKIKYESSTIILFVGIIYSMRDLLSDLKPMPDPQN